MSEKFMTILKSLFSLSVIILIVGILISSSFSSSGNIPLPSSLDIDKYFLENIKRFEKDGGPVDKGLYITRIESSYYENIFKKYRIIKVRSRSFFLEIPHLPMGGSSGYFATNGNNLLYLNRSNIDNIETLLKNENIQIEDVDTHILCNFLSEMILTNGGSSYDVIDSISAITDFANMRKGDGYELNGIEIEKIKNKIHPPKVLGDKVSGWKIEFYTFGGWMHEVTEVTRHLFTITAEYRIQHIQEILTKNIFSKVPDIEY